MAETFDPYHTWLGIPPEEQPPDHYRLLGIERFESRPEVIEAAADQRRGMLHAFRAGEHTIAAMKLSNEVAQAKLCLLNPNRKVAYDRGLQQSLAAMKESQEAAPLSAKEFLDVLGQKDLLPADLLEGLRVQVTQSQAPVAAAVVAKRLIEAGHLTPALAKRLLAAGSPETATPPPPPAKPRPEKTEDELGPAPLEGPQQQDDLQLAPLEGEEVAKRRPRKATPREVPKEQREKPPAPAPSGSLMEEEFAPLEEDAEEATGTGPLDGLLGDSKLDAAGGSTLAITPKKKGLRAVFFPPKKVGEKANVWDSSLLLISGGALLALLILFGILYWALTRQTGNEALKLANSEYEAGNYTQAVYKYDQYLKRFPHHAGASIARVRRGLCQLRQATASGTSNWAAALQAANRVVPQIATESDFKQAHSELAAMLPAIAEGLTGRAHANADPQLVARAKEALALTMKYVPKSLQPGVKLNDIRAKLALAEHDIARGEELNKAIAGMRQAVAAGNAQEAYKIRNALLKQYPATADDEGLHQALLEISRAQGAAVEWVQKAQPPGGDEPETPLLSTLALAQRSTTGEVPGVAGYAVFATAGGAAYGLDATTGEVRWRRFLGFDANARSPGFPPTPVSPAPGSDVLLVAPLRDEVVRVEASRGQPCWRHAIGEPFDAHPVMADDRLLVATRSGRLVTLDLASGSSSGYIQLPQSLRVGPAIDLPRSLIFQLADHSNLFVLGLADGKCKQVFHLGHEAGSITTPPVVAGRLLVIAVNDWAKDSGLRVLSIEEGAEGLSLKPVQEIRLKGHVDTPPVVAERRILVVTDLGAVSIFEISEGDAKMPLRGVADSTVPGEQNLIRYPLMRGPQFWIADNQLTKYDVLASHKRLSRKGMADEDSVFLQPLVAIGQTIFHVRREVGMPGVVVSAAEMDDLTHYWETRLAAPLATEPIVDAASGKVTAITSIAGLFEVGAAAAEDQPVLDQPAVVLAGSQLKQPVTDVVRLGDGLLVVASGEGSKRISVFDPAEQPRRFARLMLPAPLGGPPVAFATGLLVPSQVGQVFLINPRTGATLTEPFQPRLESRVEFRWCLPAVASEKDFVLADGRTKLYRVAVQSTPKPHLAVEDELELSEPIVSPVAIVGDVAYAVDAGGTLAAFQLPKLTRQKIAALSGRCQWGPQRVGDHVMLSTDDGQLFCLDAGGKPRWPQPASLRHGPLAGPPLPVGSHYILAATSGTVWRVEADTGKELGKLETGRPLGTGAVVRGTGLLVGGQDGSLYEVKQP